MGLTFKENWPDTRNSGVLNVITKLKEFECKLYLMDPYADIKNISKEKNIYQHSSMSKNIYDAVLIAVGHDEFKNMGLTSIKKLCKINHVIFDLKNLFNSNEVDLRL